MLRQLLIVACLAVCLLPASAQDDIGEFYPERCPIPIPGDARVDCGYLIVPERHENPDGPTIELAVAILRATDPTPRPDPVLYLDGGPGGSALSTLDGWVDYDLTRDRDLILLDQRGTGYSWPGLFCDIYDYDFDVDEASIAEYEAACAEQMRADGIDLGAYNSAQSAQDVRMLVHALGYEQVNLYGISYGTRLALTVMRDAPDIARAVVLDSPYPLHINGYEVQAINGFQAIDALLSDCAADARCNSAFPDLSARFYAWVESGETVVADYGDGELDLDGYSLVSDLFDVMYDSAAIPFVPAALHAIIEHGDATLFADLYSGAFADDPDEQANYDTFYELGDDEAMREAGIDDYDDFLDYFDELTDDERYDLYADALSTADIEVYLDIVQAFMMFDTPQDTLDYLDGLNDEDYERLFYNIVSSMALGWTDYGSSDGVFNSVSCVEEVPFNDMQRAELSILHLSATLRDSLMDSVYTQLESCAVWDVEPAAAIENEPVSSDIPTLVLGGGYDPITPPTFAEATLEGLTNAQLVIVLGAGHSVIDAGACPEQIGVAFLNDPTAPVDASCVDRITVEWVTSLR